MPCCVLGEGKAPGCVREEFHIRRRISIYQRRSTYLQFLFKIYCNPKTKVLIASSPLLFFLYFGHHQEPSLHNISFFCSYSCLFFVLKILISKENFIMGTFVLMHLQKLKPFSILLTITLILLKLVKILGKFVLRQDIDIQKRKNRSYRIAFCPILFPKLTVGKAGYTNCPALGCPKLES